MHLHACALMTTVFPLPVLWTFMEMGWEFLQAARCPPSCKLWHLGVLLCHLIGFTLTTKQKQRSLRCGSRCLSGSVTIQSEITWEGEKNDGSDEGTIGGPGSEAPWAKSLRVMIRRGSTSLCLGKMFSKYLLGPFDLWCPLNLYVILIPSLWLLLPVCFWLPVCFLKKERERERV